MDVLMNGVRINPEIPLLFLCLLLYINLLRELAPHFCFFRSPSSLWLTEHLVNTHAIAEQSIKKNLLLCGSHGAPWVIYCWNFSISVLISWRHSILTCNTVLRQILTITDQTFGHLINCGKGPIIWSAFNMLNSGFVESSVSLEKVIC